MYANGWRSVFLKKCPFKCVTIGQRLCADVFRSLILRSKVSFASGFTNRIMVLVMNGCQSETDGLSLFKLFRVSTVFNPAGCP